MSSIECVVQMDHNFLTGNIASLSSLTSLSILNLSCNNLSGFIPTELGNNISSLTQLDLSYIDLQGEIPRNGIFLNASAVSLFFFLKDPDLAIRHILIRRELTLFIGKPGPKTA